MSRVEIERRAITLVQYDKFKRLVLNVHRALEDELVYGEYIKYTAPLQRFIVTTPLVFQQSATGERYTGKQFSEAYRNVPLKDRKAMRQVVNIFGNATLAGGTYDEMERESVKAVVSRFLEVASDGVAPEPDGPEAPNYLWLGGTRHELEVTPKAFELLGYVWDKETVLVSDIAKNVFGDRAKPYSSIKNTVKRLNDAILDCGLPISWRKPRGVNHLIRDVGCG
jgi:hypothetical protein